MCVSANTTDDARTCICDSPDRYCACLPADDCACARRIWGTDANTASDARAVRLARLAFRGLYLVGFAVVMVLAWVAYLVLGLIFGYGIEEDI